MTQELLFLKILTYVISGGFLLVLILQGISLKRKKKTEIQALSPSSVKPKVTDTEFREFMKLCPYFHDRCKKEKCLAFYLEDGKPHCAALDNIILEFRK